MSDDDDEEKIDDGWERQEVDAGTNLDSSRRIVRILYLNVDAVSNKMSFDVRKNK